MRLDNEKLLQFLLRKDIPYLFHANTVATYLTFIEQGGLLSRGAVEKKKLFQSNQNSDAIDKAHGVWNDIFLDTVDIHGYFPRQNYYGPISGQFSVDFLQNENFEIWITKDNPINWGTQMTEQQKYFSSVQELENDWDLYERQRKMITIRNIFDPILFNYVHKVIVDDPQVMIEDIVLFNESIKGLKNALASNVTLKNKLSVRQCSNCFCRSNYLHQVQPNDLRRLFLPI